MVGCCLAPIFGKSAHHLGHHTFWINMAFVVCHTFDISPISFCVKRSAFDILASVVKTKYIFVHKDVHIAVALIRSWHASSTSGLVVEYIVAIDVTRVQFPAGAYIFCPKALDVGPKPLHIKLGRCSFRSRGFIGVFLSYACWVLDVWSQDQHILDTSRFECIGSCAWH